MLRRVELDSRLVLTSSTMLGEERMPTSKEQMPTRGIPTYEQAPPMPFERSTPIVRGSLHIYEMERIVILEGGRA